jgi:predicted esterase
MKRPLLSVALLFVFALIVPAQDAGTVLSTSVAYTTEKATAHLTEDQRHQADELERQAQLANRAGKYGEALHSLYQGMALMRNTPWTPAVEYATSLRGKLDHAVVEPGAAVTVTLTPIFATPRAAALKLKASLSLVSAKRDGPPARPLEDVAVDPAAPAFTTRVSLKDAPAGDYTVEVHLSEGGDAPALPAARNPLVKNLPVHVETLSEAMAQLRARLAKAPRKNGLATAEYAIAIYDRADSGELNPARVNFREEIAGANAILDSLEAGKDPFAAKRGDVHRAYRSAVDNSLQPYRLFVPQAYDPAKPSPMVVALHGMGGDENSLFDQYGNGLMKREAERVGFIVVCPKGRDTASMYRGAAEQDVLDVMADVERTYKVDAARIYLMGHSMGGFGTWSISMNHPELFAALGPISGGGSPAGMAKISAIPEYVTHGDNDPTVSVTQSRAMVEAGRKAGANIVYVEVPGGTHVSVAPPAFAPMFDFFAKQHR